MDVLSLPYSEANLQKRDKKGEKEPNIDHLHVGRLWQRHRHVDEPVFQGQHYIGLYIQGSLHSSEHQHDSEVDGDDGLEEEGLEVDGDVAHDVQQDCGQVDREDAAQDPPAHHLG